MVDGTDFAPISKSGALEEVAPGVARIGIAIVNAYLVGAPGGPWALLDTGVPGSAALIRRAAAERYGEGARPEAIILTHGHFDHAGAVLSLATGWDVPVYAHSSEMPFLTGKSDYPPQDSSMGGAIAQMARLFPHGGQDISGKVEKLPENGDVPGAEYWRWIHTPGHTPGHVSLFRETDGTLLAGDAFATMNMDSWTSQLTRKQEISRPPAPFTPDWEAARESVEKLSDLEPTTVAASHGLPMSGAYVKSQLRGLAEQFPVPHTGRYIETPARFDEEGVRELPPPVPDPLPKVVAGAAVAVAAVATIIALMRRRN